MNSFEVISHEELTSINGGFSIWYASMGALLTVATVAAVVVAVADPEPVTKVGAVAGAFSTGATAVDQWEKAFRN
ncbi:Blp family class II bacteriocin [Paenibacillus hexagrammi]|uniref:Blp family class II bacteriocin n=1 Tax=Paenibacillus hexagrammi TaxID=2908839 RepID=A0ABY3SHT9_9BACL|nr:Blp family class II bacteriocin [Paenibacillus sp. YPD9-1]UJF33521.1 Blp family class II bacteriocin [Paenibacillus sp. YPD9-1]